MTAALCNHLPKRKNSQFSRLSSIITGVKRHYATTETNGLLTWQMAELKMEQCVLRTSGLLGKSCLLWVTVKNHMTLFTSLAVAFTLFLWAKWWMKSYQTQNDNIFDISSHNIIIINFNYYRPTLQIGDVNCVCESRGVCECSVLI